VGERRHSAQVGEAVAAGRAVSVLFVSYCKPPRIEAA